MSTPSQAADAIIGLFQQAGLTLDHHHGLYQLSVTAILLLAGMAAFVLARLLLGKSVSKWVLRSKNTWDDELHGHGFFRRAGHLIPAMVVYLLAPLFFDPESWLLGAFTKGMVVYMLVAAFTAGNAIFNTVEDVYNQSDFARRAPITGFVQVGKLLLAITLVLLVIATLLDRSPLLLLSGLGAITAVLLLVFRDAILGFVAGIQIAANRMVNTGDWIEMPEYGVDGDVIEVGLTTVKVRNFDNTISTLPTYSLISGSVKNWRGMQESGGRRIKRAIYIDVHSIRFCDAQMLERFRGIRYLQRYVQQKQDELAQYHQDQNISAEDLINSRRLTNLGTFRAYLESYLHNHPQLNEHLTMMVRQLAPTENGLPLEIYCYSKRKEWVIFEGIQSDIFDHVMAMLPEFGLRAYQRIGSGDSLGR